MKYLLDTCVISDFIKGDEHTLNKIKTTSPNEIAISSITVMEILYSLQLNPARIKIIQPVIMSFLETINTINFAHEDAAQAAIIRASLKKQGCPIGSYDVLIAGIAVNHDLILVSANVKEFTRIKNLKLENWRD